MPTYKIDFASQDGRKGGTVYRVEGDTQTDLSPDDICETGKALDYLIHNLWDRGTYGTKVRDELMNSWK